MAARPTRLPVCVGEAALDALREGQFLVLAFLVAVPVTGFTVVNGFPLPCVPLGFLVGTVWIAGRAALKLRLSWLSRPSDFVFDATGVHGAGLSTADGTSLHRQRRVVPWAELRPEQVESSCDGAARTLVVRNAAGESVLVACAEERAESLGDDAPLDALDDLQAWLRSIGRPRAAVEPGARPALLRCPSCQAPLAPGEADEVACSSCGRRTPVPAEVRERLRAARQLTVRRGAVDRLVRRLLHQPGAAQASALIAAGVAVAVLAPLTLTGVLLVGGDPPALRLVLLLGFIVALNYGVYSLASAAVARRFALGALVSGFGALAPAAPGAPHTCRDCGAPLAAEPEAALATCAYCGAQNLLGLNVIAPLAAASEARRELLDVLKDGRKSLVAQAVGWAAGLAGVVLAIAALYRALR